MADPRPAQPRHLAGVAAAGDARCECVARAAADSRRRAYSRIAKRKRGVGNRGMRIYMGFGALVNHRVGAIVTYAIVIGGSLVFSLFTTSYEFVVFWSNERLRASAYMQVGIRLYSDVGIDATHFAYL